MILLNNIYLDFKTIATSIILFALLSPMVLCFYLIIDLTFQNGVAAFLKNVQELFFNPSFYESIIKTFYIGIVSTILTIWLTSIIGFKIAQFKSDNWFVRLLTPILAIPHVSFAIGLALLLAPNGWFDRILKTMSLSLPALFTQYENTWMFPVIIGLVSKEIPFLILMFVSVWNSGPWKKWWQTAQLMGHSPVSSWDNLIWLNIKKQLKLPILIILVYNFTNVEMSTTLGPTLIPPLPVLILKWYNQSNFTTYLPLSSLAVIVLLLLTYCTIFGFIWIDRKLSHWRQNRILNFRFNQPLRDKIFTDIPAHFFVYVFVVITSSIFIVLLFWSFATTWFSPDLIPQGFTLKNIWLNLQMNGSIFSTTFFIGIITSLLAMVTTLISLETIIAMPQKYQKIIKYPILIPLFIPQIFVGFGLSIVSILLSFNNYVVLVILAHWIFAFPYAYLVLAGPYQNYDYRYIQQGMLLGKKYFQLLFQIKFPMLIAPLLTAFAIGFAVSLAQYVVTLLIGNGRVNTLATESMSLFTGYDRRLIAWCSLSLAILPIIVYLTSLQLGYNKSWQKKG